MPAATGCCTVAAGGCRPPRVRSIAARSSPSKTWADRWPHAHGGPHPLPLDAGQERRHRVVLPPGQTLAKGELIAYRVAFAGAEGGLSTEKILAYATAFGAAVPGKTVYAPQLTRGKLFDNYLLWHVDAQGVAVEARLPKTDLPGFLTACVENLHDNWSVCLVDHLRSGPNFRTLPIRDGRAYAELDLTEADSDVFIGHPLVADTGGEAVGELAGAGPLVCRGPQSDRRAADSPVDFSPRRSAGALRGDCGPAAGHQQDLCAAQRGTAVVR